MTLLKACASCCGTGYSDRRVLGTASSVTLTRLCYMQGDLAPTGVTQPDFTTLVSDVNSLMTATGDTSSANSACEYSVVLLEDLDRYAWS